MGKAVKKLVEMSAAKKISDKAKEKKLPVQQVKKLAEKKKLPVQKIAAKTKDKVELAEKTIKNKKPKTAGLNVYSKTLLS